MRAFPMIPTAIMIMIGITLIIIIIKSTRKIQHIIIVLLIMLLNQRYMIPKESTSAISNNIDVLFVIDNTISMNAEDYNGNGKRIDAVKNDCTKIITELNGARFGIITFDNKAKILIPFTKDSNMTKDAIDIIEPIDEWYAHGSSLNTPLEETENVLQKAKKKDPERITVLFFISDGEITDNSQLNSYSSIKQYIEEGAILGYGTTQGGKMHYIEQLDNTQDKTPKVIMDYSHFQAREAISKIDEKNLKQIANDLNLDYIHMDQESKVNSKIKKIKTLMKQEKTSIQISSYDDTYFIITPIILLLLVLELKKIRRECP